jgi:hypothetical protein
MEMVRLSTPTRESIVAPNRAPVFLPIAPMSVAEMDMQGVLIAATDADNDPLTFSLLNEPGFVWLEYMDDTRTVLILSPSPGDRGTYEFTVQCEDPTGARTICPG